MGRRGWVDKKKKREEERGGKEKATQNVFVGEREGGQGRLLARSWSDEPLFVRGKPCRDPSAGPQMLPWIARGWRSGSRGPEATPSWTAAGGCCAQEPLTLPGVSVSPAPDTVFSEAPGDTRQRAALRMQRKLRKCCMDTRRKVARSVSSRLAPDRSDARPRARWFPSWASVSPSVQ